MATEEPGPPVRKEEVLSSQVSDPFDSTNKTCLDN